MKNCFLQQGRYIICLFLLTSVNTVISNMTLYIGSKIVELYIYTSKELKCPAVWLDGRAGKAVTISLFLIVFPRLSLVFIIFSWFKEIFHSKFFCLHFAILSEDQWILGILGYTLVKLPSGKRAWKSFVLILVETSIERGW